MVRSERIVVAVADLEPRSRALLELAPRRGMSDAETAALLGVTTADVQRLRDQAALELAAALELDADDLEVLQRELWCLDEADWERRPGLQGGGPPREGRRRRYGIVAAGGVFLAVASIAVILAARAQHDRQVATAAAVTTIAPHSGPAVAFQPLNGTGGSGSVRLVRGPVRAHVRLRVVGFLRPQEGGYTVWLYNSPAHAHRLGFTRFADFHGTLRLPRDYAKYRFVDISREVTDSPAHSGLSLLRAPLADL